MFLFIYCSFYLISRTCRSFLSSFAFPLDLCHHVTVTFPWIFFFVLLIGTIWVFLPRFCLGIALTVLYLLSFSPCYSLFLWITGQEPKNFYSHPQNRSFSSFRKCLGPFFFDIWILKTLLLLFHRRTIFLASNAIWIELAWSFRYGCVIIWRACQVFL